MEQPASSMPADKVFDTCNESSDGLTVGLQRLALCNPRARVHCFTEGAPDATIYFQLIDLGLQLYVWVGVGGAKFQNMYLAIQSRTDQGLPCVATLLADSCSSTAPSLAQRLARRVGRPVVCSWNLPQNADVLQAVAERRLMQELDKLGLLLKSHDLSTASPPPAATTNGDSQAGASAPVKGEADSC